MKEKSFQPGLTLYEVIIGSFRSNGTNFEAWCKLHNVNPQAARNALKGVNSGPSGQSLVQRLVDGAGRDVVTVSYRTRIERHAAEVAA